MLRRWLVGCSVGGALDFAAASLKSFAVKGHSNKIALAAPSLGGGAASLLGNFPGRW